MSDEMEKASKEWFSKQTWLYGGESKVLSGKSYHEVFCAGYKAHASRTGWLEINDIPEEWKEDEFEVDLWVKTKHFEYRLKDCIFINGHWEDETGNEHVGVTHARIVPPPPSPKVIT